MVLACRGRRLSSESSDNLTAENKEWMTCLPAHVKRRPISELCIPGSHDSFTSTLIPGCVPGPDQPEVIRNLAAEFPRLARHILYRWSYTQHKDVVYQLNNGIRYFDIRLVVKEEKFLIIHCLFGEPINTVLQCIKTFLDEHHGEVVILDFQHLYNFCPKHHLELLNLISRTFSRRLCPCPGADDSKSLSLDYLQRNGLQVILVYPLVLGNICWPRVMCPNPWPNTTSSTYLARFLTDGLEKRDTGKLYVSQGVFTPSLATVLLHCFSNLEAACSRRCNRTVRRWLSCASEKPNILIIDFVLTSTSSRRIVNDLINLNR